MFSPSKNWKGDDYREDLISELPDHILISIISLLTMKEAGRTNILSQRWRYLWTYFPRLNFDAQHTLDECKSVERKYRKLNSKRVAYVNWVNQVLGSYNGSSIEILRIRFDLSMNWKSEVDSWVRFAMERRVNMFELNLLPYSDGRFTNRGLYSFSSLPSDTVGFSSLTVLKLSVNVSEDVLECFLCNCPHLERLYVYCSYSLVNFRVVGSSLKLKHLELHYCHYLKTLYISAPNLVSFNYRGPVINMPLENTPKIVEILFFGCRGIHTQFDMFQLSRYSSLLQKLTLCVEPSSGLTGNVTPVHCPYFNNLKELMLSTYADGGETLLAFTSLIKNSPLLYKFCLEIKYADYVHKRSPMEMEKWPLEHMKVVEIIGFVGRPIDVEIVLFITSNACALEKVILDTRDRRLNDIPYVAYSEKRIEAHRRRARRLRATLSMEVEVVIF